MIQNFFFCLFAFAALAGAGRSHAQATRPNILFIYTDDQSHRTVSCYPEAHPWVKTPHIDALARAGVRFANPYIGTWCMPSRASMLTGLHPYRFESLRMEAEYPASTYDPKQLPFWPKTFRENGYSTAQIGKWHTGVDSGANRDWDYQVVWNRPKYKENAGNYYENQLLETNGGAPVMTKGYSTDNYTDLAVDYIQGAHRDAKKPWYMWLCYGAVHSPYTPAERHLGEYPNPEVPVPADIYPPREGKPSYMQKIDMWEPGPDGSPQLKGARIAEATTVGAEGVHGNSLADWTRQYHQGVNAIDESVGQLIEALKRSGQLENTLVVFTSDQGYAWGQHGFLTKLAPYDANIKAPLIVSMPGTIPEGKVCEHPVGGVDLIPTFFDFAKMELPWKMHGHSLTPLLQEAGSDWKHPVLQTLTGSTYGSDTNTIPYDPKERELMRGIPWWVSLRQGKYKYIRTLEANEPEELYNLDADPEELANLAFSSVQAERLKSMREAMIAELRRTDCGFVDILPPASTAPIEAN
jgi:arylsulfatase A-like enzyme